MTRLDGKDRRRLGSMAADSCNRPSDQLLHGLRLLLPLVSRRTANRHRPVARAALGPLASSEEPELLLPASPASRPRSPEALSGRLMKHGLPTMATRNTALFGRAGELPPIVISDLFGVHRNTATQWAADRGTVRATGGVPPHRGDPHHPQDAAGAARAGPAAPATAGPTATPVFSGPSRHVQGGNCGPSASGSGRMAQAQNTSSSPVHRGGGGDPCAGRVGDVIGDQSGANPDVRARAC